MKRTLLALLFSFQLLGCVEVAQQPEAFDAAADEQAPNTQACAQADSTTCDEAARCVIVECNEDPYSPLASACKDPTSDGCLKCARWARTVSLCHYLFERCNNGL